MNHDNSTIALILSWLGLVGSWITLSHLLAGTTLIFTILQIVIAVRKLRLERLQALLQKPDTTS